MALAACTQDCLPPWEWHLATLPSMSARAPWSVHRPPSPSYKLEKDKDRFFYFIPKIKEVLGHLGQRANPACWDYRWLTLDPGCGLEKSSSSSSYHDCRLPSRVTLRHQKTQTSCLLQPRLCEFNVSSSLVSAEDRKEAPYVSSFAASPKRGGAS